MEDKFKLKEIKEITGKIVLKTGLHIGAGDTQMHIGGTDNPIIKHPFTNEPYIPGSSIKGKVRSLLELKSGLMGPTEGEPISFKILDSSDLSQEDKEIGEKIIKLFGASGADADELKKFGPARVSFSDCFITEDTRIKFRESKIVLTEIKAENSINRISSTAKNPRFTERVPAGIEFDFTITMKCFEADQETGKENQLETLLFQGLKLLEMDSLGGSGSRGYGRIKFVFDNQDIKEKFKKISPF